MKQEELKFKVGKAEVTLEFNGTNKEKEQEIKRILLEVYKREVKQNIIQGGVQ